MLRAVAFDYGGVLVRDAFEPLLQLEVELGLPERTLCDEFRGGPLFAECEVGRLSIADFFEAWSRQVAADHGVELPVRRVKQIFRHSSSVNEEMLDLVGRLAGRYRLAVITNNIRESRSHWERQLPIAHFDVLVDSSEVGLRKPDPAIYELLLQRLGLEGPEVALVDDWEPNLPAAADLGINVVHFTDAGSCEAALRALGVDLASPEAIPGRAG